MNLINLWFRYDDDCMVYPKLMKTISLAYNFSHGGHAFVSHFEQISKVVVYFLAAYTGKLFG